MSRHVAKYDYTKLDSITPALKEQKVNVYGVILSQSEEADTVIFEDDENDAAAVSPGRADWKTSWLRVVDDTETEIRVRVTFPEELPTFRSLAIIRIHRARVFVRPDGTGCFLRVSVGNAGCHFVVFNKKGTDAEFITSKTFSIESFDKQRLQELLMYVAAQRTDTELAVRQSVYPPLNLHTFHTFEPTRYFDIVVQILAVNKGDRPGSKCVVRCWDGTKYEGAKKTFKLPRENIEDEILKADEQLMKAAEGYWNDVFFYDEYAASLEGCTSGDFLLVVNLHMYVNKTEGTASFALHTGGADYGRRVERLEKDDPRVRPLAQRIEALLIRQQEQRGEEGEVAMVAPLGVRLNSTTSANETFAPVSTSTPVARTPPRRSARFAKTSPVAELLPHVVNSVDVSSDFGPNPNEPSTSHAAAVTHLQLQPLSIARSSVVQPTVTVTQEFGIEAVIQDVRASRLDVDPFEQEGSPRRSPRLLVNSSAPESPASKRQRLQMEFVLKQKQAAEEFVARLTKAKWDEQAVRIVNSVPGDAIFISGRIHAKDIDEKKWLEKGMEFMKKCKYCAVETDFSSLFDFVSARFCPNCHRSQGITRPMTLAYRVFIPITYRHEGKRGTVFLSIVNDQLVRFPSGIEGPQEEKFAVRRLKDVQTMGDWSALKRETLEKLCTHELRYAEGDVESSDGHNAHLKLRDFAPVPLSD